VYFINILLNQTSVAPSVYQEVWVKIFSECVVEFSYMYANNKENS